MMRRIVLVSVLVACLLGLAGGNSAWAADGGLAGPFKFDFKLGPTINLSHWASQLRLGMHFGIDMAPGNRYHIYFDIPLDLGLGNNVTAVAILPGIEADIPLPVGAPVYIYPMFGLGMGILTCSGCDAVVALGVRMGVGVKYVLAGRWNFFVEPLNLEFYPVGSGRFNGPAILYNLLFGFGVNF